MPCSAHCRRPPSNRLGAPAESDGGATRPHIELPPQHRIRPPPPAQHHYASPASSPQRRSPEHHGWPDLGLRSRGGREGGEGANSAEEGEQHRRCQGRAARPTTWGRRGAPLEGREALPCLTSSATERVASSQRRREGRAARLPPELGASSAAAPELGEECARKRNGERGGGLKMR
jgi:hypothetical protein